MVPAPFLALMKHALRGSAAERPLTVSCSGTDIAPFRPLFCRENVRSYRISGVARADSGSFRVKSAFVPIDTAAAEPGNVLVTRILNLLCPRIQSSIALNN